MEPDWLNDAVECICINTMLDKNGLVIFSFNNKYMVVKEEVKDNYFVYRVDPEGYDIYLKEETYWKYFMMLDDYRQSQINVVLK